MLYQLLFYVPESHLECVKNAVFAAGAGRIGQYDQCCWQGLGTGQFRPLAGSHAFQGDMGQLCHVPEYMVMMVCEKKYVEAIVDALCQQHPYETPAYALWPICTQKPDSL